MLTGIWADVRYGTRALAQRPGLAAAALLTLSLGIGANAAIFSVVNAVLLRPLPFHEPDRLVSFWGTAPEMGLPVVNYPDALYAYFQQRSRTISPIAAFANFGLTLTGSGEPERLKAAGVTSDFFKVLGREPLQGRWFAAAESKPGAPVVAILSHALWQRRFGADAHLIGGRISLEGNPVTVVGVMPPEFDFPYRAEIWVPLQIDPSSLNCWCYSTIGRLAPGRTPGDAAREIAFLNDDFWAEREPGGRAAHQRLAEPKAKVVAEPLARTLVGDVRTPLLVLLASVAMVLLIACANIAMLLLARASAREREIAVRCCLGASPMRIVRQLLVESLLLAMGGALGGLVLASLGVRALSGTIIERLSYVDAIGLDPIVFLFTFATSFGAAILFGLAPAARSARLTLQDAVKDGGRGTVSASSRRLTSIFVAAQFALSLVLLTGAGLLLRSFSNLLAVDVGFRPHNVLMGRVTLPGPAYENQDHQRAFFAQLATRVAHLPGVAAAGLSSAAPFSGAGNQQIFTIKGREPRSDQPKLVASIRSVTPGYFQAIGTPLRQGRLILDTDSAAAPLVAIVDQALARRFWPNDGDAIGHEIRLGDDGPWRTIAGVVPTVKANDLSDDPVRHIYVPYAQLPSPQMDLVVRTVADPATLMRAIRAEILALDGSLPFYQVQLLESAIDRSLTTRRLTNRLLLAFALAAFILAALGIYGVTALTVGQRVREFGIRLALGATPADVAGLVVREGMRVAVFGAAIGLAGAMAATRLLRSLLFAVSPLDPTVFGLVTLTLVAIAFGACLIPAKRATAVEPLIALRSE